MKSQGSVSRRLGILISLATAWLASPTSGSVSAAAPVITISASGAKIQIASASLGEAIDAFSKAAGFKVAYEGARPGAMLFSTDIDTPSISQSLSRLLDGQNLNYGIVYDLSGKKVTTLMIFGPAPRTGSGPGIGSGGGRPQPFATPRTVRTDLSPPVDDEPEEVAEPEPAPQETPPAAPPPSRGSRPDSISPFPASPFAPRPPLGSPFGARPTPPPVPSPSP